MIELSLSQILVGGIFGLLASFFVSGEKSVVPSLILRLIIYIIAGIFGSYLGHLIFTSSSSILNFFISLGGTIVVLAILLAVLRKR